MAPAPKPWCEDEALLSSVAGGFAHMPASQLHNTSSITALVAVFRTYANSLQQVCRVRGQGGGGQQLSVKLQMAFACSSLK